MKPIVTGEKDLQNAFLRRKGSALDPTASDLVGSSPFLMRDLFKHTGERKDPIMNLRSINARFSFLTVADCPPGSAQSAASVYSGYDRSNLDTGVKPGDNFYKYAVGGYLAKHPIPADKAAYGTFNVLHEDNLKRQNDILREASRGQGLAPDADWRKLGDLYASGMDEKAIEAAGITPLAPEFKRIDEIKNLGDLQDAVAHLHSLGVGACFGFGADQDYNNPEQVIGEAFQGGIGLPEREYYFKDDEKTKKIREAYVQHIATMFKLTGETPEAAQSAAQTVVDIETSLAQASLTKAEKRNPHKTYHIYDKQQLAQLTPHFSWDKYFSEMGRPDLDKINMATPEFFKAFDQLLATRPLDDWKTYLRWKLVSDAAPYLSSPFVNARFDFYMHTLNGVQTIPPRWKRVTAAADEVLGEALGREYVKRHFPPQAKARVLDMIENMKAVLREKINSSAWMDDATKKEALAKVDTFQAKIGYPDKWKDYSGLSIDRNQPYVINVQHGASFAVKEDLAKIGKPFDHAQWLMTPQTVNAYYNPTENCIVFPAGILQPPFFDMNADDASNYGGIGAVMDHEMGHGFDDKGAQFDSLGKMRNWWQPAAEEAFNKITEGVKKQYSEFEFDGLHVLGDNVCGEAMGDLSGVEIAYAAFEKGTAGKPQPVTKDGFTPQQRFFLNFALVFAENITPEAARDEMISDEHPLTEFRVNGTPANILPFRQAFGLKDGDPMVRPEPLRNTLWGNKAPSSAGAEQNAA